MIPSSLTHTLIIVALSILSLKNVKTLRLVLVYGFLWQFSNYLSHDTDLIIKIIIGSTSSFLFLYLAVNLPPSRFGLMFVLLQIFALISYLTLFILHPMTENISGEPILETFSKINISLMWLDLIALAGITNELGRNAWLYSDNTLYHSASSFWRSTGKKVLQKLETEEKG